jgi:ATP-dependent DNA helicase DinG
VLARRFADEETSVMVATRGWMTGINVPGSTCSLIIIDRVPRNPPSAVGDARAGQLVPDGKPGFHEFDQVYGSDAAVLLEQAVGRGIRAESDRVMVAVLDPRIHAGSTLSTRSSASRKMYVDVMAPFGTKTGSLDVACRWLADLRAEQADEVG